VEIAAKIVKGGKRKSNKARAKLMGMTWNWVWRIISD